MLIQEYKAMIHQELSFVTKKKGFTEFRKAFFFVENIGSNGDLFHIMPVSTWQ
jgi:hypothetical protein